MAEQFQYDPHDFMWRWDRYSQEAACFERDVNSLILAGLDAASTLLDKEAKEEYDELEEALKESHGLMMESLEDECFDLWSQFADQNRFLAFYNVILLDHITRIYIAATNRTLDNFLMPNALSRAPIDFVKTDTALRLRRRIEAYAERDEGDSDLTGPVRTRHDDSCLTF
jgi:hypothetical protein